ncbi:MAG: endonuclease/exonuclease/phosphatase family protein [Aliarcobacter sp.]|nr:endonuclease/exonuclease/phosphatase family protein [Aliarcobacter sp.]
MFLLLKFLLLFIFAFSLKADTFTIASYNVENLFDLKKDNTEYNEFIPNNKSLWNQRNFNIKLNNLIKVINDIDADIIALQEIENRDLMQELKRKLPQYSDYSFVKYPKSAVGIGILSKIKIKDNRHIDVKFTSKLFRPILETTFIYENIEFKVFNNHWPSKAVAESYRIQYAKNLQDRLTKIPKDYDYILIGDFNSDYDEYITFQKNQKLNNSYGITGINQILNTTSGDKFVTYDDILNYNKRVHFNLWLDLPTNERFSSKYRDQNNTPDSIILSPALFDTKKISYILNSFEVFKPSYLYKNNQVNRWQMSGGKFSKTHKGEGFSDHLPILAKFSINKEDSNILKKMELKNEKRNIFDISYLYKKEKLVEPIVINNAVVIYKNDDKAIIKKPNDRAVYIYNDAASLKLGYEYNLQINQIFTYNGLKEVKEFAILDELRKVDNYKNLYLDANQIDIFDFKYENEIIKNLKGVVRNSKLYLNDNKYIKIYSKNRNLLPKNGETITILNAQLGSYKGNIQLIIHNSSDFKIGF